MRLLLVLLLLLPGLAGAQGAATLVADDITVAGGNTLTASGNIEVFYDGLRLRASAVTYDRAADLLRITGPIVITGAGGEILLADSARLDPRLRNGMLRGARLVLDRQLQLAAAQIDRAEGRYSQLYRTAVTSCTVCGTQPPLWEIRAERVVHDQQARQLYFTNAQFRLRGTPLFWLPRMRLPDPTLERATGFLIPRLRTSNLLGTGLKLPYFITLGDSRDVMLTPYASSRTTTLEARYRQAFAHGTLRLQGAVSQDDLQDRSTRSYLFVDGQFDLPRDYRLSFGIEAVSDDAYLLDYGYSGKDRLDSDITLTRVRRDDLLQAGVTYFESLRADEINATLPPIVAGFRYERRLRDRLGGTLDLVADGDALLRYGTDVGDQGRDMARLGLAADWGRSWISHAGLVAEAQAGLRGDLYRLADAPAYPRGLGRARGHAALTLRYPLVKTSPQARHLLEPLLALAWSGSQGTPPPNEDSTRPEFDAANLLALSRFPGQDAIETGARAALGLHWRRLGHSGTQTDLTIGRVLRDQTNPAFTGTSGQLSRASDWLWAGSWQAPDGLRIAGRGLLTETLDTTLAEARVGWQTDLIALDAAYIWQNPDGTVGRDIAVSEWSLETRVQVTPAWAVSFDTRYDVGVDAPASAALGFDWRNECMSVNLSVSRRYTSSTTVDPSTDYGLEVALSGFSAGRSGAGPVTRCSN